MRKWAFLKFSFIPLIGNNEKDRSYKRVEDLTKIELSFAFVTLFEWNDLPMGSAKDLERIFEEQWCYGVTTLYQKFDFFLNIGSVYGRV